MSKTKEHLQYQQDVEQEYKWKFMDWMYDTFQPQLVNDNEINDMEREQNCSLTAKNIIVSKSSLNNQTYNQQLGEVS